VIKTSSGTASAVAEAIDVLDWDEVLGTVAGDNTILVVARSKKVVKDILDRLGEILR